MVEALEPGKKHATARDAGATLSRETCANAGSAAVYGEQLKEARCSAAARDDKQLVESRIIPKLAIDYAEKLIETAEERERRVYYQAKLAQDLPIFAANREAGESRGQADWQRRSEQILAEQKRGEFGRAS